MSVNLNKSGLGKFAGMRGTIFKSEIAAAKPSKQIVGKGIGKGCNYPMDSDAEFEKRLRRYERKKQARKLLPLLRRLVRWRREICLMASLSGSRTISHMKL